MSMSDGAIGAAHSRVGSAGENFTVLGISVRSRFAVGARACRRPR